jgi:hypothetical protein
MNQGFTPPMPQMPQMPSGGDSNSFNSAPQQNNFGPSQEKQSQWTRSVARSAQIKNATNTVIKSRSQFKAYLQQNGMDLYTSAVEFQHSGDFIMSSYIVYTNYNNYQEPLATFLQRYPQFQQAVIAIRDRLRPAQQNMQVLTPKLSQTGQMPPFANGGF